MASFNMGVWSLGAEGGPYTAVNCQIWYLTVDSSIKCFLLDLVLIYLLCLFRHFPLFPIWVLYTVARSLGGESGSGAILVQILELLRSANLQSKETYAATVSEKVRSTREPIIRKS